MKPHPVTFDNGPTGPASRPQMVNAYQGSNSCQFSVFGLTQPPKHERVIWWFILTVFQMYIQLLFWYMFLKLSHYF